MRFYVASKFENKWPVRAVIKFIEDMGHEVTQDWTNELEDQADMAACAALDVMGVQLADVFILIPHEGMKGAWVEFGLAVAKGMPIVVAGDPQGCIFEHLVNVKHVPFRALRAYIERRWGRR